MSPLHEAARAYLQLRRRLGFLLKGADRILADFATMVDTEGGGVITTELALRWARRSGVQPATWAARLALVRGFAAHHSMVDRRTEVPPAGLLPARYQRQRPYIYSDIEVRSILGAAADLTSRRGVRGLTYAALFALMAATGLRISEAVNLDRAHVDFDRGVLIIERTKFGATRIVPVHGSTREALHAYGAKRDAALGSLLTPAFFVSERRRRVTVWSTRYNFALVSRRVGLREATEHYRHGHGPRLHDLRHRFAVQTLLRWYRAGIDVERQIPKLSAYLGHVHVNDTYWYIEAVPELLELAAARVRCNATGGLA